MSCPPSSFQGTAVNIVENQIDAFTKKGDLAYRVALDALQAIASSFTGQTAAVGVDFVTPLQPPVESTELPVYNKPVPEPETLDVTWESPTNLPNPPNVDDYDYDTLFSDIVKPVLTATPPILSTPGQPNRSLPAPPSAPDPLVMPDYPTAPEIDDPVLGSMRLYTIPVLSVPNLTEISELIEALRNDLPQEPTLPDTIDYVDLVEQFFASSKAEISDILAGLVTRIAEMLEGGTGLPDAVALTLRNRAFSAEDRLAFQAEQTAIADWLSRGFTLPGGALEKKILDIRQQNRDKVSELNRTLWLEESKLEIENLRFAVQQGIAYEGMWKDALIKLEGIAGDLAAKAADVQLKLVDAAIAVYTAKANMWQIQFASIKDQIQIELSKVEIYKAELDAQRLIGELNRLDVEIYKEQWNAVRTKVDVYKTQVDAANSMLQAELGKLQYAAETIKLYVAEIGAWETEWKAYGEAVRAETSKVELYKGLVQGFTAEVDAYAKNVDAAKTQATLRLNTLELRLKSWESLVQRYTAEIQGESARVSALADIYDTTMKGYSIRHDTEKTFVETELTKLTYLLNVDRFNADVTLKEAELEQTKLLETSKIAQASLDAVARTGAQLAGSAMSAMNVGASLGANNTNSDSTQCQTSYNYTF